MTLSALLMIVNVGLLWWLFSSASGTAGKLFLFTLALLNSWLALERFQVLPTRLGGTSVTRPFHRNLGEREPSRSTRHAL